VYMLPFVHTIEVVCGVIPGTCGAVVRVNSLQALRV
jgi:hypothetical protein